LMLGGIRLRWFVLLGVVVAVAAPLAWPHLKVYQQKRILTFVHPEMDPRGAGYHVLQSKIAVGSGMMWGKGFLRGTQNQLNFLPVVGVPRPFFSYGGSSLLCLLVGVGLAMNVSMRRYFF